MTVLTIDQAKAVCPKPFGLGELPPRCDVCQEPWSEQRRPVQAPYGPFVVHVCWPCSVRIAKGRKR